MYLSRIALNTQKALESDLWLKLGDPYQLHRTIWRFFSHEKTAQRDFIYRADGKVIYTLSKRSPVCFDSVYEVQTKAFAPKFKPETRLSFVLRANPVVSKRDENGKQHRHDLVMEQKHQLKLQGLAKENWPMEADLVQKAGLDWLLARALKNGFVLDEHTVITEGYRQQRFPKKGRRVSISLMDIKGILQVNDPDLFLKALYRGFGSAKGFGCGLMLIKGA